MTPESIVIDGANGVCANARNGPRSLASVDAALSFGIAVLVLVALFMRPGLYAHRLRVIAFLGVAALAVPGWWALMVARADAPAQIVDSARSIDALAVAVERFAAVRGCVEIARDECVACEPIVRLASAGYRPCAATAPRRVILAADAFVAQCTESADVLTCGHLAAAEARR